MQNHKIVSREVGKIFPYEKNAKKHEEKQVDQVARSIERFGFVQPIVIDKDGRIIIGHCRFEAALKLKMESVPVIEVDNLTADEVTALRIADNKLNESNWDWEKLNEDLKELVGAGFDITLTGFGLDQINEEDEKENSAPSIPSTPTSKRGDLYICGQHRILCGDSTNVADVERVMDGKLADMIFTDPPYNVNYSGGGKNTTNKILGDDEEKSVFQKFLDSVFVNCAIASKGGAAWYVFHAHKTQSQFEDAIEKSGWKIKNQIIWNKPSANLGWGDYMWKHEPIFYCGKENTIFYGDRCHNTVLNMPEEEGAALRWLRKQKEMEAKGYSTVWSMKRDKVGDYKHPTQKPVELVTYAIFNSSKGEDIIFDPFLGSGTTLIAAEKTKRICYAIEMDERYVDVAVKRWEEYTGLKSEKF